MGDHPAVKVHAGKLFFVEVCNLAGVAAARHCIFVRSIGYFQFDFGGDFLLVNPLNIGRGEILL